METLFDMCTPVKPKDDVQPVEDKSVVALDTATAATRAPEC